MASTAKVASKKVRTYASAVAGVTEKSIFSSLAKCTLKSPRHMPHARIPNTTEQHSFFIDLKSTDASEEEVLAALTLDGIVGAHSRDDLWVVKLICESDAVVEAGMTTVFNIEGKKPVEAIWPRHKTNKHSLIKIVNVPIGNRQELMEKLSRYWLQYGKVIDTTLYMFPGKPWLTKRWDLLLQLNDGVNKLDAPPVFQLDGYTDMLVCSWVGAKKACLRCKSASHSTSKCPASKPKNQKVGELANPLQKIGRSDKTQKKQKKGSEVLPGDMEKSKASSLASTSATKTVTPASPATVATPIPAPSGNFTVTVPLPTIESTTEATASGSTTFLGSELQNPRPSTPPTPMSILQDPDTPRRGNKRLSKDDGWMPTAEDLRRYTNTNTFCRRCVGRHLTSRCTKAVKELEFGEFMSHSDFHEQLKQWVVGRKKRGQTWRLPNIQHCVYCKTFDHDEEDCPEAGQMEE